MISIHKSQKPAILVQHEAAWTAQLQCAATEQQRMAALKHYRHKDIKAALMKETHEKCAYCESKMSAVCYAEVEHIKPKCLGDELAFEWNNLTIACRMCNNNKGDYWDDLLTLVNPYVDDPADHFYVRGAHISGRRMSERGVKSVQVFDLNRAQLYEWRCKAIDRIEYLVEVWRQAKSENGRQQAKEELVNELGDSAEYARVLRAFVRANMPEDLELPR